MGKVSDIIDGWKNYFQGSDSVNLETAKERAGICTECPAIKKGLHAAILPDKQISKIKGFYCGDCGCPLSTAVRSSGYECPRKKW